MADHNLAADRWLEYFTKDEGERGNDPNYCIVESRKHLLQLMYFSSQLLSTTKLILDVLIANFALLLLVVLGYVRIP